MIFYDDYHVRRGSALAVKRQLTEFIRKNVGPMDILGVMYPLTPFSTIGYTRNHEAVIKEIEALGRAALRLPAANEFEERYAYYPTEVVERVRNQVSLSALEALVTGLGTKREGRKSVILISEGYSNYLPPQLRDPSAAMPGVGNPNRNRPLVGERTPDERNAEQRAQFFSYTDLLSDLREVFTAANRANCAIYALDPRGLAAFEFDIDQGVGQQLDKAALDAGLDTLRTLADETDGRAILNSNDLVKGLRADGEGRQLVLPARLHRVVADRRQVQADPRARQASRPAGAGAQGLLGAVDGRRRRRHRRGDAGRPGAGDRRGPGADRDAAAGPHHPHLDRHGARRERPHRRHAGLGAGARDDRRSARAAGAAGGHGRRTERRGLLPRQGAGRRRPRTGGRGPPAAAGASTDAGGGRVTFQAPPGPLQLRMSVEGAAGQVLDSDFRDVVVPDYAKAEPLLSVPALYRARTQRDVNLLNADANPRPSTAREFSRTERLHVRFQAYAPGGGAAAPTARLLNRVGSRMADVPVRAAAARGPADFEADIPLASLPAGDYLLEVALPGEQAPAKQLVAFRVTS